MDEDDVTVESDTENGFVGDGDETIASEDRAETKLAKLRKELEQLRKEKQENLDGWQRSKADYVNALRRFEQEKKLAIELGKIKTAEAFIPAMDSLERAKENGELPEGFIGILKQLESAAKSLGLVQFGTKGDPFDPMLHEALGNDATENDDEDNTVSVVLEQGWKMNDQIIRPAKVRVAHLQV